MGSDSYASSARRASRRYGPAAGTIKAPFTALWPVLALLAALAHGAPARAEPITVLARSEEHTSELQSLMRISYAVFCLKKKNKQNIHDSILFKHSSINTI